MASPYIKATAGVMGALALVVLPVVSAYAVTENTTVSGTISPLLTLTAGATVDMGTVMPTGATAEESSGTNDVTVTTNSPSGYTLDVKMSSNAANDTNNLAVGWVSGSATAAGSRLVATTDNTATLTANSWGYKVGAGNWQAMPINGGTADSLASTSGPSAAAGDTVTLTYGFSANANQPAGTYTGEVLYTAAAK